MASTVGAVFSYAQAAKGRAPSTQANSTIESPASSENGSKEIFSDISTEQPRPKQVSSNLETDNQSKVTASIEAESNKFDSVDEEVATKVTTEIPQATSETMDATHTSPASASESGMAPSNPEAASSGRNSKSEQLVKSPSSERSIPSSETDKAKETDDDWEKVSVPSIAAEKELKAAPLPPVNIWMQRKEAQDAKAKTQTGPRDVPAAPRQRNRTTASIDETRRQSANKEPITEKDANVPPRRVNSGARATHDRKDQSSSNPPPRSASKQNEKSSTNPPPSTSDAEFWPTPDTTPVDERRRSSVLDKGDKTDSKSNNQKKSWIQMPFVPTAKFETQLPPAAAARRGGRPGNRGRETAGRGGNTSQSTHGGDKSEPGLMGPPPLPNKSGEHERGRKHEIPRDTRSSSVPSQGNRAVSKDSYMPKFRQTPNPTSAEATDGSALSSGTQSKAGEVVTDENVRPTHTSRSSSRKSSRQQSQGRKAATEPKDASQIPSHNPGPSFDGNMQQANHVERQKGFSHDGVRTYGDYADRSVPHGREWSRGRIDAGREKPESWRGSRESRPDRGRGGYRGRGNHPGYNAHGSGHTYTPPMIQNGFDSSRPNPSQDSRPRQASQSYNQAPSMNGNRGNPRSQSIPVAMMQQTYFNPAQGYPAALSPTEMTYGNYPHQIQGSIMETMPYHESLNSYALISMVITQLEYYFSIDNLCKDMFLRKHMDSQGYVFLNVILGFKRIQALTEGNMNRDQLRSVCQQVRNIEFVTGDDGEDRLRSRENWRDFVLPMEERFPASQNNGPTIRAQSQQPSSPGPHGYASPNGSVKSPQAHLNGFAEPFVQPMSPSGFSSTTGINGTVEHGTGRPDTQAYDQARRSSTTSPFTKVQSPGFEHVGSPSSHMTNGHRPSIPTNVSTSENTFPDEKIPELKVVVRDPAFEAPTSQENGASGLRGGAGSPSQLEQFRPMHFGQNITSPTSPDTEQPPYWTKDGDLAKIPVGPGFVHEDYLALHEKAIAQRLEKHLDGALSVLYSFWSSFLVGNFNVSMYKEFVELATSDVHAGSENGKGHLLRYYDSLLTSKTPMSERIAVDIVTIAREEAGDRRPMFQKLRGAWRNGATNLKTRKRLGDVLTVEEKTEFDKGV